MENKTAGQEMTHVDLVVRRHPVDVDGRTVPNYHILLDQSFAAIQEDIERTVRGLLSDHPTSIRVVDNLMHSDDAMVEAEWMDPVSYEVTGKTTVTWHRVHASFRSDELSGALMNCPF